MEEDKEEAGEGGSSFFPPCSRAHYIVLKVLTD